MRKIYLSVIPAIFVLTNTLFSQPNITVVYPREGQTVTAFDSTFIFGQVYPPHAQFSINGESIPLHRNGTYLAFLPIHVGDFTFSCIAVVDGDTSKLDRYVVVPGYLKTSTTDSLVVDPDYIFPKRDWQLHEGDVFRVSFKGTPGCRANFTINGVRENIPMTEVPPVNDFYWGETVFGQAKPPKTPKVKGIYTGAYWIQPGDWRNDREIQFQLTSPQGDSLNFKAPGRLTILDTSIPIVAELTGQLTVLRTEPWLGYHLFLPERVRLWITGRHGKFYRVRLATGKEAWVHERDVRMLPPGTVPPKDVVSVVRVQDMGRKTRVKVFTKERVPFRIEQFTDPSRLEVTLYGVTGDTDWIRHDFVDPLIREIRWSQSAQDVYKLLIELNQKQQWGYNPFYDDENHFNLDIKKAPPIAGWPHSPLKDIFVLLDPGHEPDLGAVGPTGLTEKDANLMLANVVKSELEKKGSFVTMTREGQQGMSLRARPKLAAILDADILLSLHHNALPDGVDPFKSHGTSTYYYHPQSYELARLIQEKLLKKLGFNNFGLFYDNLALCRPPQMPAVLIEPAFMMYPEEEMLIASKKYREKVSDVIVEALEEFLKKSK